jgi:hypothetical protein
VQVDNNAPNSGWQMARLPRAAMKRANLVQRDGVQKKQNTEV